MACYYYIMRKVMHNHSRQEQEASSVRAATITSKGQVTIPKSVRDALSLRERDKIIFVVEGNVAIMRPGASGRWRSYAVSPKGWHRILDVRSSGRLRGSTSLSMSLSGTTI